MGLFGSETSWVSSDSLRVDILPSSFFVPQPLWLFWARTLRVWFRSVCRCDLARPRISVSFRAAPVQPFERNNGDPLHMRRYKMPEKINDLSSNHAVFCMNLKITKKYYQHIQNLVLGKLYLEYPTQVFVNIEIIFLEIKGCFLILKNIESWR